jgi:hypothetical protein
MNQPALSLLIFAAMATVARAQEAPAAGGARSAAPAVPQLPRASGPTTLKDAWTTALATMRAQKAPGLVFVLPPADAKADPAAVKAAKERFHSKLMGGTPVDAKNARELLLLHVQLLRQESVAAAFGLAVPVVATATTAGAKPGETLVLLNEDGTRTAGFAVDLADPAAVASALQPYLFAPERLAPRRANVPPAVTVAVRDLDDVRKRLPQEQDAERQQALLQRQQELIVQLQSQLFAAAPALHETPANRVPAPRGAAEADLLGELLQWTTPLGTEVGATWDPCPPCGMMALPMPFRSALKLLAQ